VRFDSGVCRAEDIKHDAILRALLPPADASVSAAVRAGAALERLDQFVKLTLAQRVAGEESFMGGKPGHNALLAFVHSDHRALEHMVATAGPAKVPLMHAARP
jgi:hypothetical protein